MKKELEQRLCAEFPNFFKDMYGDPKTTCLSFGCTCGDGWFDLIYQLCKDIAANNPSDKFKVAQVKEKFGTLRFYVYGANEKTGDLIQEAEKKSETTCELCGDTTTARLRDDRFWWHTFCDKCEEETIEALRKRAEERAKV